jgi:hypothetical protein
LESQENTDSNIEKQTLEKFQIFWLYLKKTPKKTKLKQNMLDLATIITYSAFQLVEKYKQRSNTFENACMQSFF